MQKISRYLKVLVFFAIVVAILVFVFQNYEFVFRKDITGQITGIDRVSQPTAILGSGAATPEVLFSFAVALKDKSGEFFTASSEDRQWAVVKQGDCAEVIFYPYPPWDLKSAGTYHNARLKRLLNCKDVLPAGEGGASSVPNASPAAAISGATGSSSGAPAGAPNSAPNSAPPASPQPSL